MARVSTAGGWAHNTDAAYRAWVGEVMSMLTAAGLVQTSDTGQINLATAVKPTVNGFGDPAIYRFNDALQATAPIFLRLRFGTGPSSSNNVAFAVQMGTGTDGAGNLTGLTTDEHVMRSSVAPGSATDYQSRAVHRPGLAALAFKIDGMATSATNISPLAFIAQRIVDNTGAPTGEGAILITPPGGNNNYNSVGVNSRMIFSASTVANAISNAWLGRVHGALIDSRVGLSPQAFLMWITTPKQKPLVGSIAFLRGEVPLLSQMSLTIVGTASRNYLQLGRSFGNIISASGDTDAAILWED